MKKIIILIISSLFLTGCVDYKELNTLSYVTGMGIDYKDDEYIVTYEIMDTSKEGSGVSTTTFTVEGTGKTNYEAQVNATNKLGNEAFFSHTQVLILTENLVNNKLTEIVDYIMRNPQFNEECILLVTSENTPKEIFEATSDENPSASIYITNLVESNRYSEDYYINLPFAVFSKTLAEEKIDSGISNIKIEDDIIILNGLSILSGNKIVNTLSVKNSNIYNSFLNSDVNIMLNTEYEGSSLEASTKFEKTNIDVTPSNINITFNVIVEIKKSPSTINLEDNSSYEKLSSKLEEKLEEEITDFIKLTQTFKSDLLGFSNLYYIDTRKDNNDLWQTADINIDANLTISRKGLIYNASN